MWSQLDPRVRSVILNARSRNLGLVVLHPALGPVAEPDAQPLRAALQQPELDAVGKLLLDFGLEAVAVALAQDDVVGHDYAQRSGAFHEAVEADARAQREREDERRGPR